MLCAQISANPIGGESGPTYVMGVANGARSETFAQQETYVTSSFGRKSTRFK